MDIKKGLKRYFSPCIKMTLAVFPDIRVIPNRFRGIKPFIFDFFKYRSLAKSKKSLIPAWKDTYPQLEDRFLESGNLPEHYFYQDLWAAKLIFLTGVQTHIDIGSSISGFVAHVSVFCSVKVIDIRPQTSKIENVEFIHGDITQLQLEDESVESLSCLHAAEHIGLGRYGDTLDPLGTQKAAKELQRVLAKNGNLYFSVPIGKERTCFNAHRVFFPRTIVNYFSSLKLISFSVITDDGRYLKDSPELNSYDDAEYSCGLFYFKKN